MSIALEVLIPAIAAAATSCTQVANTWAAIAAKKTHNSEFDRMVTLLDNGSPDPSAPLARRIQWVEGVHAFDRITRPRSQSVRGGLVFTVGIASALILAATAASLIVAWFDSSMDWWAAADLLSKFIILLTLAYFIVLSFLLVRSGFRRRDLAYYLDGDRLPHDSSRIEEIRALRDRLGVIRPDSADPYFSHRAATIVAEFAHKIRNRLNFSQEGSERPPTVQLPFKEVEVDEPALKPFDTTSNSVRPPSAVDAPPDGELASSPDRDPRFRPQDPEAYDNTIGEHLDPDGPEEGA